MYNIKNKASLLVMLTSCLILAGCERSVPRSVPTYTLKPPFDLAEIQSDLKHPYTKKFTCKVPPEPLKDLFFESMYDKNSENASIVDPEAYKTYKEATKPVQNFEVGLATTANLYVRSIPPRPEIASCVISWLTLWADAQGMLGKDNHSGEFIRKWILASIAMAYIQVRDDANISAEDHQKVRTWIAQLAARVTEDFTNRPDSKSRNNNHMYWAAWGVMASGIALDDQKLFDWALYETKTGLGQIQQDGTLELELARGSKAYNYHHFAAIPLFMMAETAYANKIDLFDFNDKALQRLARVLLENMDDQSYFEKLTGEKQDLTRTITSSNLVWLEIYRKHFEDKDADRWLEKFRPVKQSRVGGNATLLYGNQ